MNNGKRVLVLVGNRGCARLLDAFSTKLVKSTLRSMGFTYAHVEISIHFSTGVPSWMVMGSGDSLVVFYRSSNPDCTHPNNTKPDPSNFDLVISDGSFADCQRMGLLEKPLIITVTGSDPEVRLLRNGGEQPANVHFCTCAALNHTIRNMYAASEVPSELDEAMSTMHM